MIKGSDMKQNKSKNQEIGFPKWFVDVVKGFQKDTESLEQLLDMTTSAIRFVKLSPHILQTVENYYRKTADEKHFDDEMYKFAENMSRLAKEEVDNGFARIYNQVAVGLWATLEATMVNVAAGWIYNNKKSKEIESIAKLKIRMCEYEGLTEMGRCEYIVEQLERDIGGAQKLGVSRFETLLGNFYKTESVPAQIKKYLYELSQVRNVILHRAGIADESIIKACPWLGLRNGQKIVVTKKMMHRYFNSAMLYMEWTLLCVLRNLGVNDPEYTFRGIAVRARKLDKLG